MKAIHRKALRDLWHMRGQALAIALVIASGIAMLVMSQATLESLRETRARLYSDYRLSHVWANVKRAPNSSAARIAELGGVNAVEARLRAAGKLRLPDFGDSIEAAVLSASEAGESGQNRLYLRSGRLLDAQADDEMLVSDAFAQAHRLRPGARITLTVAGHSEVFTVVGVVASPEFLYQIKPGAMFPDYERYAIVWLNRRALEAALDMHGAFNELVLRLAPGASESDVIAAVDRQLERFGSRGAYGRGIQLSARFLDEEFRQLATMTKLFPTIFLAVAAFLLNVVFTRLIGIQRDQVAVLKAFGYHTRDVVLHYALIVVLICLLGAAIGLAGGIWLGKALAALYQLNFRFPFLDFSLSPGVALLGIGLTMIAALAGAGYAVFRAAGEPVAEAMRPPAPERYVKTQLERLWFARHAAQTTRMVLRQLERRPFKALLTIVGLALAGAIMMMAQLQLNAINYMTDMQYRLAQQQDMTATFTELASRDALGELRGLPGVRRVEGFRAVPVRLRRENHSVQTMIEGLPGDGVLRRPVDVDLRPVPMPGSGLLINDFLAQRLGVVVGDRLWVEVLDGELQRFEIPVAQLTREYMGVQAYMELDALNDRLGDGDVLSGASLTVDEDSRAAVARALDKRPRVAGSELRLAAIDAVYKTISQMTDTFTWVAVIMGGVINFGVIYNSARIALAERGRELASLRVLGFTQGEVSYVLLGEQAVLVLLSIPLSFAAGYGLSWFLATNMQSDLYRVPVHVPPGAYAFAALVTIVSALLSALAVRRRIAGLDMIAVLKTRE